ncbi:arsenate reductase, partial [Arthrospira platensis SPKY1]|nr:arsenate reductase [Arthrospira platensis SPKY1]
MSPRRILFVCIGNAYRSQMAEGFMRSFAGREFDVFSAGLSPAPRLPRETVNMMAEMGIDVSDHFPKSLDGVLHIRYDVIVNISGTP